ncbi:energy transducer TonB [Lysobacter auxotrophicus]|uniref:Protein TonB n=1 Tax=Lysobacter auxotrophicus TaxID=2992573 RepID=A0ABM8D9L8_9GAMM|nr:energy transducer TonB [Lysobacter auxotrophicus]BDU15237.1 TonB family protein [Lysobacter auxotrophicus]
MLALGGCEGTQAPVAQEASGDAGSLPAPVLEQMETQPLRARAEAALREQRLHTPAGDNAVEYYLALREREPDSGVSAALAELQPYVLIATEQALAQQQLDEARRLIGLLARMDTQAPALPRLRESLRVAQERADRDEGARIAEAAKPVPVAPAPTPTPALARVVPPSAPSPVPVASPLSVAPEVPVAPKDAAPPAPIARTEPAPAAMPRLLRDAAPRYPLAARNRRIEGSVQVAFTIQPDGTVTDVRTVSAQPEGLFEQAALAAAARWQFEPTPRRVTITRTVTFRLPPDPKT